MSRSWSSITVKAATQDAVLRVLRRMRRAARVGPLERGWVVIFERDGGLRSEHETVVAGCELTAALDVAALAVVADDRDVLRAWCVDRGRLVDGYHCLPDGLRGVAAADPEATCRALGVPDAADDLRRLIEGPRDRSDALFLHDALVAALGMPQVAVGLAFRDIEGGCDEDRFARVPARRRGSLPAVSGPDAVAARVVQAPLALGAFLATTEQELAAATHASDEARRLRLVNHLCRQQLPVLRAVLRQDPTPEQRESVQRFLARAESAVGAGR